MKRGKVKRGYRNDHVSNPFFFSHPSISTASEGTLLNDSELTKLVLAKLPSLFTRPSEISGGVVAAELLGLLLAKLFSCSSLERPFEIFWGVVVAELLALLLAKVLSCSSFNPPLDIAGGAPPEVLEEPQRWSEGEFRDRSND